jgi:hypothetical protein
MDQKFSGMNEQLKKTEKEIRASSLEKIKPLTIRIISELENLANMQAYDVPPKIFISIKNSLENIRNTPYSIIRNIGDEEVKSRLLKMKPKQQEAFERLWRSLADELFGKVSQETSGREKMLTRAERESVFIDSVANEWARRILGSYENDSQLNFGALLSSMEREFSAIPSLPGQLEGGGVGVGGSRTMISVLNELKDKIMEEIKKIANETQLEMIKKAGKGGAIKKMEDVIDSYQRMLRGEKMAGK